MEEQLLSILREYENYAIIISIMVSILVALLGVVPSVFVTGANVLFFGFTLGTLISFIGEVVGAIIAFYLYRKGFQKVSQKQMNNYPKIKQLVESEGKEAFFLILSLRLLPFVPSGLVTFAGAIGKVSLMLFALASTVGKIPALLIEAYSVYQVMQMGWQGKVILTLLAVGMLLWVVRKLRFKSNR
ncbi:VTT domain-containing protein [Cytobacillus sp. S13-E01]|uniref:TVP38/TMEM64 family protein n=1 Tax=Cytobacillus sp. S13-E01 TaxID=3031326 RepID=UPI0023D89D67|nr:VTT domain-containing protein [Cytobacillus sp. S13-E01]MDF0725560.1 VTT domain-containing protein [Cytobacillus sp. S13-E01]